MGTPREHRPLGYLESDLTALSLEVRRGDGFTGLFASGSNPDLRRAVDHALQTVHSLPVDPSTIAGVEDIFRPIELACSSRNPNIAASAMTLAQKLLADRALSPEQTRALAGAISEAAKSDAGGDVTRLKCVQCALALVQSVEDEATTAIAMSACVRVLRAENEGVSATAAATTRQAAFHVFSRLQPNPAAIAATPTREGAKVPTLNARAEAALLLFEDLCALAGGKAARWLGLDGAFAKFWRVKIFALDAAAEVAVNSADLFVDVPAFHRALRQRLCAALVTHLQSWQRSDVEEVSAPEGRAVLRCVGAVIGTFHEAVPAETEMFLTTLLASLETEMEPWRRSYTLEVIKATVVDGNLARFLHAAYDARDGDSHKMIFRDSVLMMVRVTRAGLSPQPESGVEDILAAVTVLHRIKGKAQDVVPEDEDGAAHIAFSVFLALEGVMGAAHSIASLATAAAEGDARAGIEPDSVAARDATEMIESCSEMLLETLETVLTHATGEVLVRDVLRALQAIAQGCGVLGATDARDAFISAICHFAVASEVVVPTVINIQDADDDAEDTATRPSPLLRNISADSYEGGREPASASIVGSVVGMGLGAVGAVGSVVASPVRALVGTSSVSIEPEVNPALRVVLTSKNLQAFRTLLNVAHRLIDSLGDGWVMVLETLCSLRRMLATKTSAVGADMDATVAVLHVAEQQLFESTAKLDDDALCALTKALAWASSAELGRLGGGGGKAPVNGSKERLFMLERLVDVALINSGRIHKVWSDVEAHLLSCIEKEPSAELCRIATASLARLCVSALELPRTPEADSLASEGEADFQTAVLRPVITLMARADSPDARLAALDVLISVVNGGDGIGRAWSSVLRALRGVAERGGEGVALAFSGVKVIVEDRVEDLPDDVSGEVIAAVSAFVAQRAQVNISITAVSLAWTLSDYFSRKVTETKVGKEALAERGMIPLLSVMRDASMDPRPEVRNGACRTITSTLVSNGDKLPARIWRRAVFDICFGLVDDIRAATAGASQEEQVAPDIGELDGRKIQMLVHHSRNSARKQWDETETLALSGVGRLLRAHFDAVAKFDGFDKRFEWYLQWITQSVAEGSPEVSCSAVKSLQTVLEAGGSTGMTRARWKKATKVLMTSAKGMNAAGSKISGKTRYEFIDVVGKVWASKRAIFDKEDVQSLIGVIDMLARAPDEWLEKSAPPARAGRYSTLRVQRRCLELLSDLPPLDPAAVDSGAYPQAICQLLAYVAEALGGEVAEAVAKADFAYPGTETQHGSMSLGFAQEACEALAKIYQSEHVPKDDRAMTFAAATRVISAAMTHTEEETAVAEASKELRGAAAKTFRAVVTGGLAAVTRSSAFEFRAASVADAWDALSTAFESTLAGKTRDPNLERDVIECMAEAVSPHCGFADEHSRRRLIAAVAAESSVSRIWALSALHFGGGQMGRIALQSLVPTCEGILRACDEPEKVACVLDVASSLARDPSRRTESEPAPQSSSLLGWIKKTVAGEERNDLNHLRAILGALGPCESSSDDVIRMKAEKVRRELTDAVEIRKE